MADSLETQRIPLAYTVSTRDSTLRKDALMFNCMAEKEPDGRMYAVRRFGIERFSEYEEGEGLGLFAFSGQALSVIGPTVRLDDEVLTDEANIGSRYQFTPTISEIGFYLKNNLTAYWYDGTVLNPIVDEAAGVIVYSVTVLNPGEDYTEPPDVVFTGGGGMGATATAVVANGMVTEIIITDGGAGYTSAPDVTLIGGDGTGATAFATISVNAYPAETVPGVAYLDGFVFVMDLFGRVWNCEYLNPLRWNPLSFVQIQTPDAGVAITRHLSLIVGFGSYTTSFFYNAGVAFPASPLLPQETLTAKVGCASAQSIVTAENTVFWLGQTQHRGRSVYVLDGLVPTVISDPFIDRILANDTLANVSAFYIEIGGHKLYVLTLRDSNVTLTFDMVTKMWAVWSFLQLGSQQEGTILRVEGNTMFLLLPNHGLSNGDIVTATNTGAPATTNNVVVNVLDKDTITYDVAGWTNIGINAFTLNTQDIDGGRALAVLSGPKVLVTRYVQTYYPITYYAFINNIDLLLGENNGIIYRIGEDLWTDDGSPIYQAVRTFALDFGSNKRKFYHYAEVIADKVPATAYVGYTDDDFETYSKFRPVNLNSKRAQVRRCSWAYRRAWEVVYIEAPAVRWYELELDVEVGVQ